MAVNCRDSRGGNPGDEFDIQTWSGYELQEICRVRGTPTIKHYVEVVNQSLKLSPMQVWCEGILSSQNPVIRFVPERSNDTSTYWKEDWVPLQDQERATFSRALQAVDGEVGKEEIRTSPVIKWLLTGQSQPFSLKFEVSTG